MFLGPRILTLVSNSPFWRFLLSESPSPPTELATTAAITIPSSLRRTVMVVEQVEHSQKYSAGAGRDDLAAGSLSRRNSFPSVRRRNGFVHDGLLHLSSIKAVVHTPVGRTKML